MIIHIHTPEELARSLKDLRKKYKVSQPELAKELGKSSSSILRYEKGYAQISVETAIKILQFFVNRHIKETVTLSLSPKNAKTPIIDPSSDSSTIV